MSYATVNMAFLIAAAATLIVVGAHCQGSSESNAARALFVCGHQDWY